jgi:polar amino acid transport system substrate-binding protein
MKAILLSVLFLLPVSAFGAESVSIATFPIPLMVESKDKGVFIELTRALAKEAGFELTIVVLPPQRTLQEFSAHKVDGVFPGLKALMPESYVRSGLVYMKNDYAFTVKGSPPLATVAALSGKRVGITSGYPYAKKLMADNSIHFDVANSDDQNVKKLLAGRLDAFVVEEKSGLKAFSNNGSRNKVFYNPAQPISEQDVFYAFQEGARGERLAAEFSRALVALKDNGTFARIMAKAK